MSEGARTTHMLLVDGTICKSGTTRFDNNVSFVVVGVFEKPIEKWQ